MFATIASAKDHINMETYILDDDEVGQRFVQALVDKQQQGVNAITPSCLLWMARYRPAVAGACRGRTAKVVHGRVAEPKGRALVIRQLLSAIGSAETSVHLTNAYFAPDPQLLAALEAAAARGVDFKLITALVDGVWATVGLTKLDWRSFLHNHELNAVILGTEFGSQVQAMFDKDLASSDRVTLTLWNQRPLGLRIKEMLARTFEYWL